MLNRFVEMTPAIGMPQIAYLRLIVEMAYQEGRVDGIEMLNQALMQKLTQKEETAQ